MFSFFCILRQEFRILIRDPGPFVALFIMPALAFLLFTPALGASLREQGFANVTGVESALPGMSVMFGSLGAAFMSFAIFREHQWQTWERLLISPASLTSILLGKIFLPSVLIFLQQILLLILGIVLFELPTPKLLMLFLVNAFLFGAAISALGLFVASVSRSLQQSNAIIHVMSLLLAATCHAFVPISQLPWIIQKLAFVTPSYWLTQSHMNILMGKVALNAFTTSSIINVTFCVIFLLCAARLFRNNEHKTSWA